MNILDMLDGVRETGGGNYIALCPGHDDHTPSLSVKLIDDGRILLHCFAGCDISQIVNSMGLSLSDLMPETVAEHLSRPVRRSMPARDGLRSLTHEAFVVSVIAADMLKHRAIDGETWDRLAQAVCRIDNVRQDCS